MSPLPLRVLIVEDRPTDAELVVDRLREEGFNPEWQRVETESAYLANLDNSLDLILSDFSLPHFNATRALILLKQQALDVPFIIISGTIGEEIAIVALKQGATDYLLKDRLTRLGEAVKQAVRQRQLRNEKRKMEDALKASAERFRSLVENSADIIAVLDANGIVQYVNPSIQHIIGYDSVSLIGKMSFDFVSSDGTPLEMSSFISMLTASETTGPQEIGIRHKDSSLRMLELVVSNLLDNPNVQGIVINARDITDRKRAEVEERTAEMLRGELEKQRELLELKEQFIAMVSHDFRTPLAVIQTSTDLLKTYFDRLSPEKRLKFFRDVSRQIEYMIEMLDDVLVVNKFQAGKLKAEPAPLDLVTFCQDVLEQLKLTDIAGHQFTFTSNGNFEGISLDENLLRHILFNLLSNAIKYTLSDGEIGFEVSILNSEAIFRISDNGIGIPVQDQARLFEAFHRAQNATQIAGTGLGLAIVKSSVAAHGGTIEFQSEIGIGTTFTVRLPSA